MGLVRKAPTIQEVARYAGVSAATVSRFLSSPERVSETTRERVHAAVSATGYTINQAARSLRMRAARTILIALPDIGNPFYSAMLDAVVDEASRRGYGVMVASRFDGDPSGLLNAYFLSSRADGLLLFDGGLDTRALNASLKLQNGQLPLVVSYDETPDSPVNIVNVDNEGAAEEAVRHLLGLGHRRIAHVIGLSRNAEPNPRLVGFRRAMQAAGLEVDENWLVQGNYSMQSGVAAADRLLSLGALPTAVFCGNDEMAIGLISRLGEHGVSCPRDISVIGFDDIDISSHYVPPLTTMRHPRDAIGRLATRVLIDILEGTAEFHPPVSLILPPELVVRRSTRRIA